MSNEEMTIEGLTANQCQQGGAIWALRHMLAHTMAENFLRKPKHARRDCDAYFQSAASHPSFDGTVADPLDLLTKVSASEEAEHSRMWVAVRARIEERLNR